MNRGSNLITVPDSFTTLSKTVNLSNPQFTQLPNGDNSLSLGCCEVLMKQCILDDKFNL